VILKEDQQISCFLCLFSFKGFCWIICAWWWSGCFCFQRLWIKSSHSGENIWNQLCMFFFLLLKYLIECF